MGLMDRIRTSLGPSKEIEARLASLETRAKFAKGKTESSGVPLSWGQFEYEQNSKLRGADKYAEFDKMEADPHVKSALMDKALPLQTAEWEIKAASDSERDIEIAEFVSANLLRTSGDKYGRDYWIETPWAAQRLPEILTFLRDGFSLFACTWKRVGSKVVYDRLQWIEPQTIDGTEPWVIDNQDNIIGVNRKFETPQGDFEFDKFLPAESMKLYCWDIKGARYEGRAFIRSMYGAWFRKDFDQRLAQIWAQKFGSPPPVGHYPPDWSASDKARFKEFLESMRGSSPEWAYGMFPKDSNGEAAEVAYAGLDKGEVDRMGTLIDSENSEIAHAGGTKSGMLGETETGSRALGGAMGAKEAQFAEAIGVVLAEWENHGVANLKGTIEDLVDRNFAGVQRYPELVCSSVDPFANFGRTLEAWKVGIIPKHEDARRQITEGTLGINLPDEAYEIEEPPPMPPGFGTSPDGPGSPDQPGQPNPDGGDAPPLSPGPTDDGGESGAMSLETADQFAKRIAPMLEPMEGAPSGGNFRAPTKLEAQVVSLAVVSETYRVGERDCLQVLRAVRTGMKADLMRRLAAGKVTTRNLDGLRRSKFRGQKKGEAELVVVFTATGSKGMAHVKGEIGRQR